MSKKKKTIKKIEKFLKENEDVKSTYKNIRDIRK